MSPVENGIYNEVDESIKRSTFETALYETPVNTLKNTGAAEYEYMEFGINEEMVKGFYSIDLLNFDCFMYIIGYSLRTLLCHTRRNYLLIPKAIGESECIMYEEWQRLSFYIASPCTRTLNVEQRRRHLREHGGVSATRSWRS